MAINQAVRNIKPNIKAKISVLDIANVVSDQLPKYDDAKTLAFVVSQLQALPPLVNEYEILDLITELRKVQSNKKALLHIGDCAENINETSEIDVIKKIGFIERIRNDLQTRLNKEVVLIGRYAGQYAKPRSRQYEKDGTLISYRGDIINSYHPEAELRRADPFRMLKAYVAAKKFISTYKTHYSSAKNKIFFSHEALLLYFDNAFTRQCSDSGKFYNLSTHFPWLGVRTVTSSCSHINHIDKISNPAALKVGAMTNYEILGQLLSLLTNNSNRLINVIYRYGYQQVEKFLPLLFKTIEPFQDSIIISCDPMHGNTKAYQNQKCRYIEDILSEIRIAGSIHKEYQVPLHGIHLEASGDNIFECRSYQDHAPACYRSLLDPRLNTLQTQDVLNEFADVYINII